MRWHSMQNWLCYNKSTHFQLTGINRLWKADGTHQAMAATHIFAVKISNQEFRGNLLNLQGIMRISYQFSYGWIPTPTRQAPFSSNPRWFLMLLNISLYSFYLRYINCFMIAIVCITIPNGGRGRGTVFTFYIPVILHPWVKRCVCSNEVSPCT